MNIAVVKCGDEWLVPCREWASIHMDRPVTSRYRTKGNAIRAVQCPDRNLMTELCHRLEQMYRRLCFVENSLFKIKYMLQKIDLDLDYDVQFSFWDSGATESDSSISGTGGSSAGEGIGVQRCRWALRRRAGCPAATHQIVSPETWTMMPSIGSHVFPTLWVDSRWVPGVSLSYRAVSCSR